VADVVYIWLFAMSLPWLTRRLLIIELPGFDSTGKRYLPLEAMERAGLLEPMQR
jgi:hypothetical protein